MKLRVRKLRQPRLYLTRRGKVATYAVLGAAWGTGILWIIFHYWFARQGEFGREPFPAEHWSLAAHGAAAFGALLLGGWLWPAHIGPWWTSGKRRSSGVVLIGMAVILIVSGYALYYASSESLRDWIAVLHWSVGLAFAVPFGVHALSSGRYRAPPG